MSSGDLPRWSCPGCGQLPRCHHVTRSRQPVARQDLRAPVPGSCDNATNIAWSPLTLKDSLAAGSLGRLARGIATDRGHPCLRGGAPGQSREPSRSPRPSRAPTRHAPRLKPRRPIGQAKRIRTFVAMDLRKRGPPRVLGLPRPGDAGRRKGRRPVSAAARPAGARACLA